MCIRDRVSGAALMEKLKELIHGGNVRRIILKNPEGRTLFDMPLNAGIAGMALLPFWAAVGAVAVLALSLISIFRCRRAFSGIYRGAPYHSKKKTHKRQKK